MDFAELAVTLARLPPMEATPSPLGSFDWFAYRANFTRAVIPPHRKML
jgi:hypothetical protein